jgi:hypothetical protein
MSVARPASLPWGDTMFPPRAHFFQMPMHSGNLPVPLGPLPAHRPDYGR